jgi:hypothetical protein
MGAEQLLDLDDEAGRGVTCKTFLTHQRRMRANSGGNEKLLFFRRLTARTAVALGLVKDGDRSVRQRL